MSHCVTNTRRGHLMHLYGGKVSYAKFSYRCMGCPALFFYIQRTMDYFVLQNLRKQYEDKHSSSVNTGVDTPNTVNPKDTAKETDSDNSTAPNIHYHNCTVTIQQQVNGGTGHYHNYQPAVRSSQLPDTLATDAAMQLWQQARAAGWVNEHYQLRISQAKASLLADYMGQLLELNERWKPFEELWDLKSMRKDFDQACGTVKAGAFIEQLHQKLHLNA